MGVAILTILISHIGNFSGVRYFTPLGPLGVSLFLMVSGYGLSESFNDAGLKDFFRKRARRVLLPYWIVLLFYVALSFLIRLHLSAGQIASYVVLWELPTGMYWYLQFIIFWYISFFICCRVIPAIRYRIAALFAVSVLVLIISNEQLITEQAFFFPLGAMLSFKKAYLENLLQRKKTAIVSGVGLGMISLTFLILKQLPPVRAELSSLYSYLLIQIPMLIGGSLAIMVGVDKIIPFKYFRLTDFLGKYCYEIYLTHAILLHFLMPKNAFLGISGILILVSLLLSLLLKRLVDLMVNYREVSFGQ